MSQLTYSNVSDEVMNTEEAANLDSQQKSKIQELFSQGVKHKMRMNFVRQMSKTSSKPFEKSFHSPSKTLFSMHLPSSRGSIVFSKL